MNQINRTPDQAQPRNDASAAPRGEELQKASSAFADLLTKESKRSQPSKTEREIRKEDGEGRGMGEGLSDPTEAGGGLPFGLPWNPDQGGSQSQGSDQPQGSEVMMEGDFINRGKLPREEAMIERGALPRVAVDDEPSRRIDESLYVDTPFRVFDETFTSSEKESRPDRGMLPRIELGPETAPVAETPLPTPGDLMLQAFSRPVMEQAKPIEKVETPTPVANVDAIQQLGEQIAERILISKTEQAGASEMLIQLKDSILPGTEVRVTQVGERLQVTLLTDHASSFHLLAAKQAELQAKLGDNVVVQLSFDPDGMISQQRMERPLAAEAGQQAGDDRRRDREHQDDRREQRRRDRQDGDQ